MASSALPCAAALFLVLLLAPLLASAESPISLPPASAPTASTPAADERLHPADAALAPSQPPSEASSSAAALSPPAPPETSPLPRALPLAPRPAFRGTRAVAHGAFRRVRAGPLRRQGQTGRRRRGGRRR
uniref:Uncharacterized protein n=1 Tax=Oryza glaberrima TaxID=4538 RepID=I1PHG5_ORYGL